MKINKLMKSMLAVGFLSTIGLPAINSNAENLKEINDLLSYGVTINASQEKIDENGAGDIVTLPTKIVGVEVGAYIRKRGDGFKVSLRSNEFIDVSKIAEVYGGGGHIRAAGFSSNLPIDELKASVKESLKEALLKVM